MRHWKTILALAVLCCGVAYAQLANSNYEEQGGLKWHIGGELEVESTGEISVESSGLLDVESGGEIDINSGATLDVNGTLDIDGATTFGSTVGIEAASVVTAATGSTINVSGTLNVDVGDLQINATAVTCTGDELNQLDEAEGGIETGISLSNDGADNYSGSAAVTFAAAKTDAAYIVLCTLDNSDGNVYYTANSTTGFTINVTNASDSSDCTVSWWVFPN